MSRRNLKRKSDFSQEIGDGRRRRIDEKFSIVHRIQNSTIRVSFDLKEINFF